MEKVVKCWKRNQKTGISELIIDEEYKPDMIIMSYKEYCEKKEGILFQD